MSEYLDEFNDLTIVVMELLESICDIDTEYSILDIVNNDNCDCGGS